MEDTKVSGIQCCKVTATRAETLAPLMPVHSVDADSFDWSPRGLLALRMDNQWLQRAYLGALLRPFVSQARVPFQIPA